MKLDNLTLILVKLTKQANLSHTFLFNIMGIKEKEHFLGRNKKNIIFSATEYNHS